MACAACATTGGGRAAPSSLGIFTSHGDVGVPSVMGPGSATYDAGSGTYTVTGGGENMWAAADHFQYVWVRIIDLNFLNGQSADLTSTAARKKSQHRDPVVHTIQSMLPRIMDSGG